MLKPLSLVALAAVILTLAGCRSKSVPVLYKPGDMPTWRLAQIDENAAERPVVKFETSLGAFSVELFPEEAPISVENFLRYVQSGHYDGTIFHRVISGFMVQGGGFTPDMREKVTASPIQNESNNGLSNRRGTLAMARKDDPHSSTSQFFVNLIDNTFLDGGAVADGYTVFGRVTEGMPVIDRIAGKETHEVGAFTDVPVDTVTIFSAERED